jgi:hypothetical protein
MMNFLRGKCGICIGEVRFPRTQCGVFMQMMNFLREKCGVFIGEVHFPCAQWGVFMQMMNFLCGKCGALVQIMNFPWGKPNWSSGISSKMRIQAGWGQIVSKSHRKLLI